MISMLAASQLCLPPALALAAAVAEAHAAASAEAPGTSYPRLDDLGQNMRYTAALLWASGDGRRQCCRSCITTWPAHACTLLSFGHTRMQHLEDDLPLPHVVIALPAMHAGTCETSTHGFGTP